MVSLVQSSVTHPLNAIDVFEKLPNDIIINHIACYLTPQEASTTILVSKRFAKLFGDSLVWAVYYRAVGLEIPKVLPNKTGNSPFSSPLAKNFPRWSYLQNALESLIKKEQENLTDKTTSRSLGAAILTIPELYPMHDFTMEILQKRKIIPEAMTKDEFVLEIASGSEKFSVVEGFRKTAIQSIIKRSSEAKVKKVLISILNGSSHYDYKIKAYCKLAEKGLVPFISEPEVLDVILKCLKEHGAYAVVSCLDELISDSKILKAVVNSFATGLMGLHEVLSKHIHKPEVVFELTQILSETTSTHLMNQIAESLIPAAHHEIVQKAICKKLIEIKDMASHSKSIVRSVLENADVMDSVVLEYGKRLPLVRELAEAKAIKQLGNDVVHNLKMLIKALTSNNQYVKIEAAVILAPYIEHNPDIQKAFLGRIKAKEYGEVAVTVVRALGKIAYRDDICMSIINDGPLDGNIDKSTTRHDPLVRVAAVKALSPYIYKPMARKAFLERFINDESPHVRCAILDTLAPQIDHDDIKKLFMWAGAYRLRQNYIVPEFDWQVVAINKLSAIINQTEVKKMLQEVFSVTHGDDRIKAACIRVLTRDSQKPLIKPSELLMACVDSSLEVQEEARKALVSWIAT